MDAAIVDEDLMDIKTGDDGTVVATQYVGFSQTLSLFHVVHEIGKVKVVVFFMRWNRYRLHFNSKSLRSKSKFARVNG